MFTRVFEFYQSMAMYKQTQIVHDLLHMLTCNHEIAQNFQYAIYIIHILYNSCEPSIIGSIMLT